MLLGQRAGDSVLLSDCDAYLCSEIAKSCSCSTECSITAKIRPAKTGKVETALSQVAL